MKRYSGLHDKLCTIENIEVADDNARKKIKDKDFLIILDEIIDSTDSVRNTSSKLTGKKWYWSSYW